MERYAFVLLLLSRITVEEELESMISNANMGPLAEGSDSYSSSNPNNANKRQRQETTPSSATQKTTSSAKFKGVVLQCNGHWGAQIYAKHKRIWLGTFTTARAAAMAYDSAAINISPGASHRNFPSTKLTIQEQHFQGLHSSDAVLNMIKDGSYPSKFMDFIRTRSLNTENTAEINQGRGHVSNGGFLHQQLFQKELTPSDVGKLNRLVIPKKHATKYFPAVPELSSEDDEDASMKDDTKIMIIDTEMTKWEFRYCYWKSSQSFVFTRGWNKFVKDKNLKAKDVITFYSCENREAYKVNEPLFMIDVTYSGAESSNSFDAGFEGRKVELQLGFGQRFDCVSGRGRKRSVEEEKIVLGLAPPTAEEKVVMGSKLPTMEENLFIGLALHPVEEKKGVRIFGFTV
ncbi:hypothetical protein GIB67_038806 [Kingdonia uniflora]|uniref:Uncharacterized protein n=1 Tax=Kingdonia uniflora TaxID=39325 RepID=A0A7J7M0P5_9MAGN|nr:hypothetical protein GIB67_038806 [Kingdonia uniflora]